MLSEAVDIIAAVATAMSLLSEASTTRLNTPAGVRKQVTQNPPVRVMTSGPGVVDAGMDGASTNLLTEPMNQRPPCTIGSKR